MTEIYFKFEKSTKRAYRFIECTKEGQEVPSHLAHVGTLYVKQVEFPEGRPKMLRVTIEEVK